MLDILIKAFSFVLIILLGYLLKRRGVFRQADCIPLAKVMMNITLPAAVITAFSQFSIDHALLLLVGFGLGCNLLLFLSGYLVSRKRGNDNRALFIINTPGYNIGCFALPYVQSFLGPVGVVATCLFDIGNSVICTGGSYVAASHAIGKSAGFRSTLRRLFSSVPFVVYLLLLLLALPGFRLPEQVTIPTAIIGNANPFLAMLIIGIMLEINVNRVEFKNTCQILALRYAFAAVFAAVFYYLTPFPLEVRQALAVVAFAPCSSLSPIFTAQCGAKAAVASFTGSMSIIISIVIMTALMTSMHL